MIIYMGAQSIKQRFWMSLFEEKAQLQGVTVKQFCDSKNVSERSYWYFHKKLADEMEEAFSAKDTLPSFLELRKEDLINNTVNNIQNSSNGPVEIRSIDKSISISINEDISDQFLLRIMRALNNV